MSAQPQVASAHEQLWSSVGSAGVVNINDIGKVEFTGALVKLQGSDTTQAQTVTTEAIVIGTTRIQAVIRYEITPVRGLVSSGPIGIALQIYGRRGDGDIQARLMAVSIPKVPTISVTELPLITYEDQVTDRLQFVPDTSEPYVGPMDFVNDSFYVELTLRQLVRLGAIPLHPPAVASIHLVAYAPLVDVPRVIGDSLEMAIAKLKTAGLQWSVRKAGPKVIEQDPDPDYEPTPIPKGASVELTLGKVVK
jgi:PASTA domain